MSGRKGASYGCGIAIVDIKVGIRAEGHLPSEVRTCNNGEALPNKIRRLAACYARRPFC